MSQWQALADRLDPPKRTPLLERYRYDPVGFTRDCYLWKPGEGPTDYQNDILDAVVTHKRVAVRGPHGIGKTALDSWLVLWFALTRDDAGDDWKLPATASAWRQLTHFLWPEVHKWARRLDWSKLGREPFTRFELLQYNLKLRTGEAFTIASDDPASLEGAHGDQLFYLFDEAKTIPGATFDAAEGAFSGAGSDTVMEAFALANSTPGETSGRFYEIHKRSPAFADWHTIHVNLDTAVNAKRISRAWADKRKLQWGEQTAVYQNRVLGEFCASDEDGVIPLSWVEAANDRWRDWAELGCVPDLTCVGVDVARGGADKTVIALRHDTVISELVRTAREDLMQTSGRVARLIAPQQIRAVIDVNGIGAGVVDRLREQHLEVIAFGAAEKSGHHDTSGELGFVNKRAAAWWNMRELLEPANGHNIALPPDDLLTGDLTAPHWRVMSGGKIQVESKDDIHKRIGRSTDDGDAVIQAFWTERGQGAVFIEVWKRMTEPGYVPDLNGSGGGLITGHEHFWGLQGTCTTCGVSREET